MIKYPSKINKSLYKDKSNKPKTFYGLNPEIKFCKMCTYSNQKPISEKEYKHKKNMKPVFFIEKDKIELINKIKSKLPYAIFPELISTLSSPALVTALASRLKLAISIDNGVMHMIGLTKVPMIVLFGPTDSEKFAPKRNSVQILDSKKIYNSKDIKKITVNDVYSLI